MKIDEIQLSEKDCEKMKTLTEAWYKLYAVAEIRNNTLVIDYYHKYKKGTNFLAQGKYTGSNYHYYLPENKSASKRSMTTEYEIAFLLPEYEELAREFFNAKPLDRIIELEQLEKKKKEIQKAAKIRSDMELFSKPIVPPKKVLAYARKIAPGYLFYKDGISECSKCGSRNENKAKHGQAVCCPVCDAPLKVINRKIRKNPVTDDFWIMIPGIVENQNLYGSFFRYTQVYRDGQKQEEYFTELARYTHGNRLFTKKFANDHWKERVSPWFSTPTMYNGEANRCENCYVIPRQFAQYLGKLAPDLDIRRLSASSALTGRKYWDNAESMVKKSNVVQLINMLLHDKLDELTEEVLLYNAYCYEEKWLNLDAADPIRMLKLDHDQYKKLTMSTAKGKNAVRAIRNFGKTVQDLYSQNLRKLDMNSYSRPGKIYAVPENIENGLVIRYVYSGSGNHPVEYLRELYNRNGSAYTKYATHLFLKNGKWITVNYNPPNWRNISILKKDLLAVNELQYYPPKSVSGDMSKKTLLNMLTTNSDMVGVSEKLIKSGFAKLNKELLNHFQPYGNKEYYGHLQFFTQSGKFHELLGISREFLSRIRNRSCIDTTTLDKMRIWIKNTKATYDDFIAFDKMFGVSENTMGIMLNGKPVQKTQKYLEYRKIDPGEYTNYIRNLIKLRFRLDSKTVYPQDFEAEQVRISELCASNDSKEQKAAMQQIRNALMNTREVKKFLNISGMYLICVPESPQELINEGKKLHNCIGTYVERVAKGLTSVFFIRETNNPNAPYYAMEYRDGRIIQVHGNCNCSADQNVLEFANGWADVLRKIHYDPKSLLNAA